MGDMFRSEKMVLCQMFIQPEAAYTSVSELGETGCAQFRDLNEDLNSYQRKFVNEVRRCDELERKIRYIEKELNKDFIKLEELFDNIPRAPNPRELIDLEAHLEKTENEILELAQNAVNLKSNYLELTELRHVLESTQIFFSEEDVLNLDPNSGRAQHGDEAQNRGRLGFVAGVINRERIYSFERMLWRISRGNVFLKRSDLSEPLTDPNTGYPIFKTVFVAFFQGEQLKARIKKVCTGFHAAMYPCPNTHAERDEMLNGVRTRLEDLKLVLSQTEDHRSRVLITVSKNLPTWAIMVKKMKAIYHTLNLFNMDVTKKCLIGECWVPVRDLSIVQKSLSDGSAAVGSTIPSFLNVIDTKEAPPTYHRTNKFTRGYQNLIDAYGVATYREVNPALYTCITFPFLFAVMFGDMGHGFIMFLVGAWMTIWEKKLSRNRGEIWNIYFSGRYIILLMGLFAIYTGFIYNDIFSKSINVFGSTWRVMYNTSTVLSNTGGLQLNPSYAELGLYPMGLDPIWQLASNQIIFTNSYKMKLSIIFGVIHMTFGVCLSVVNHVHFRNYIYIILEFIPQILFLLLLFGYMVFMMFFKWVVYSAKSDELVDTPGCAPSILILFINMMLFKANTNLPGCDAYMFPVQPTLQMAFVGVALICIPWLLLGKPLYIMCQRSKQAKIKAREELTVVDVELPNGNEIEVTLPTPSKSGGGGAGHEDEETMPMSDVFIYQAIHTVEYILSTISHTASYLRLWALSLAHAELSLVLWNMVLALGFRFTGYGGGPALFIFFAGWAFFTISIMVMMEGLSAFLHTLRLHWVEFMSKFYKGLGYPFQPFSFKIILETEEED